MLFSSEGWAVKLIVVHVTDMLGFPSMLVVFRYDLVKEVTECVVSVMRASINSNSRVNVLDTRKNHLLKRYTLLIFLSVILIEYLRGQIQGE